MLDNGHITSQDILKEKTIKTGSGYSISDLKTKAL